MKSLSRYFPALLLVICASCSILKKDDPEKDVRNFLTAFQADLAKADDKALSYFRVAQTKEAISQVIDVLQNNDPFIVCEARFEDAQLVFEKERTKVSVPVSFRVKELDSSDTSAFMLELSVSNTEGNFKIVQINGEAFYENFASIKFRNEWEAEKTLAVRARMPIYENARQLEAKFDSVIWYAQYKGQTFFYVTDGPWTNFFLSSGETQMTANTGTKMGLTDAEGNIVIPLEYDLIGSMGFFGREMVEVTQGGKTGYFNVESKELIVEPVYDLILPYLQPNVWAIVKKDTTYGWLDDSFEFTSGFPSVRAKEWVANFEFLRHTLRLKPDKYSFCEIPSEENAGSGIIIPPAYLSRYGVFDTIEPYFMTTTYPIGGVDYKETTDSFMEKISASIRAVITTVRERYIGGRDEFYTTSNISFVNADMDTLHVSDITGEQVAMHVIDSSLLEVQTPQEWWFMENSASDEYNLLLHSYFSLSEGSVKQLKSTRLFPQTQFVKLDSSYLTGKFLVYNSVTQKEEPSTFLSRKTITFMRDEILASYGYEFPEEETTKHFEQVGDGYNPRFNSLEEFEDQMTDVDRHNLDFLNKILAALPKPLS